jgi:hypothetical protein
MKILYTTLIPFLIFSINLHSQESSDSLENLLSSEVPQEINYTTATFKATRIINGQSIERMPQGQLDVRFHHRFGAINQGSYGFWGLDGATTFLSLEYGITNWVMAGVGRANYEKAYDGFMKFSLFRQSTGMRNMPFSISWFSSIAIQSEDFPNLSSTQKNSNYPFYSRLSYVHQLLIARKFNEYISLQLSPSLVHNNLVPTELDLHDIYALGLGGRVKLTKRISFNAEYFYVYRPSANLSRQNPIPESLVNQNPLSFGFDIETGGHVFQLLLTNSNWMIEKQFIGQTTDKWNKAGIHIGFNISRVFDINHHK